VTIHEAEKKEVEEEMRSRQEALLRRTTGLTGVATR